MTIEFSDYNAVQARIARIMGVGDGDYGYGQQIMASSQQDPQTGELIWLTYDNLRRDILTARYHQIGTGSLPIPELPSPEIPSATLWATMKSVLTQVESSRTVVPPADQLYRENLITSMVTSEWNSTTVHTVTVMFDSADLMRNYFNTGSSIEFSASRISGPNTGKNASWTNLLSGMGIISFRQASTKSSTALTVGLGFSRITTTDQVIFQKYAAETAYVQNSYSILAKTVNNATGIQFTIRFADDAANMIENDVNISGTLTSMVSSYHAVGEYVTVNAPVALGELVAGTSTPTFTINRDSATISEGLTGVTFDVVTSNFNSGAQPIPVYWKITGTGITASDFEETKDSGVLSGQFDIIENHGTFTLNATADALTEGTEKFNIELRTTPTGPVVASIANALEQILDLSKVPVTVTLPSTYTFLTLSKTLVPEGDLVSFTLVTTNVPDNTQIYWTTRLLSAGLTAEDFADAKLDGVVTVAGNVCTIDRLIVKNDAYDEGIESFQLQAYAIVNGVKTLKAASSIIQISDTIAALPDVPYTVVSNNFVTSIQEGSTSAVVLKIGTPKLPANTRLYWLIIGELGNITSSDFVGNTLQGSVLVNNQAASLTLYAASDNSTEGLERFKVYFYRDETRVDQVLESDAISITETVPYTITRVVQSISEGSTGVVFTVTTPYLSNQASELFWTTVSDTGTVNADDFEDGQTSGSVWITNATGTIIRRARTDLATEGNEQFHLELRATPGTSGPLLATSISQLVTITENVQYTMSPSATTITEGAVGVTFNISTPKLPSGTLLYWETLSTNGIVNAADFTDNKTSGTITVTDNSAVLTRTAITDALTEGNEAFIIKLRYPANASGTVVASSEDIVISELVPYKITPSTGLISEGSTAVQFNVSTPKVPTGTVLKWRLVALGNIVDADVTVFDSAESNTTHRLSGLVAIGTNNKGSFTISTVQDNIVEDQEGFKIELLDQEDEVLATSSVVNIKDISPYRVEFSTGTPTVTVWEGGLDAQGSVAEDAAIINVYTPWVADGTELYWTTVASMGNITASDFTDNVVAGKVAIFNNQGQIIRRVAADKLSEGMDSFYIQFHETSYTSPAVAASGMVLITNTSNTPEVPEPVTTSYTISVVDNLTSIVEGEHVTFHIQTTPPVATGTDLYWSLYKGAGVTADDFTLGQGSPTSGLFHVNANGWADITITPVVDQSLEGSETFLLQVHEVDPYTMPKMASPVVTITDAINFSVSASKSVQEGNAVTFTVKTPKSSYGSTLVWGVSSSIGSDVTASDFVEGTLTGTVDINQSGIGTFTLTATDDSIAEGTESFVVNIVKNGDTVATSWPISITELATYTLTTTNAFVDEGQSVTFTINTPKLTIETAYTWTASKRSGTVASSIPTSGVFTVLAGQTSAQFVVPTTANNVTEGTRTFQLDIVKNSTGQPIVISGVNPTITIRETVTQTTFVDNTPVTQTVSSVPYLIKLPNGAPTSVVGGDPAINFIVTTPAITDTDLKWELVSTIAGKVTSADVDAVSGTVSISANTGAFSILPLQNPNSIDTSKTFTVRLRNPLDQLISLGSSAPVITITKPVLYTYSVTPSTIKEGGTALTVVVHTPAESASQTLNWAINTITGLMEPSDFAIQTLSGVVAINQSGTGTFTISAVTDGIAENDSFNFTFTKASGEALTFTDPPTVSILDVEVAAANWIVDVADTPRESVIAKKSKRFSVTAPVGYKGTSVAWRLVGDNVVIPKATVAGSSGVNGVAVFVDPTADPKTAEFVVNLGISTNTSMLVPGSTFHVELVTSPSATEAYPLLNAAPVITVVEEQFATVVFSAVKTSDQTAVAGVDASGLKTVGSGETARFTIQLPQGNSLTTVYWSIIGLASEKINGTMQGSLEIDPISYSGTVPVEITTGSKGTVQDSFVVKFYKTDLRLTTDEIAIKDGTPNVKVAFDIVIPVDPLPTTEPTKNTTVTNPDNNNTETTTIGVTPKIHLLSYPGALKEGSSIEFKIIVENTTSPVDLKWVVKALSEYTVGGISSSTTSHITTDTLATELITTASKIKYGITATDLGSFNPLTCTITKLKLYTKKSSGPDICGPFNVTFTAASGDPVTTTDVVINETAITQTYITSSTWTVPKNCTRVTIKAAGGGGGAAGYDNSTYWGGIGGDTAHITVDHNLPTGTKQLKVTVGTGGGGGAHHGPAGKGGIGYMAGGAGGQYRSIGSSGSGGGGGGGTAVEAILTNGTKVLLVFVGGGGGGGGGSFNKKGNDGNSTLLTNHSETTFVKIGETGSKQTLDGGTGGGGGAGNGGAGINGKDKSTGGMGGTGGIVYCNPTTQVAEPTITRMYGTGGALSTKGVAGPGSKGIVSISTVPGDCRAEVVQTPIDGSTPIITTLPVEDSLDPNMFRKDGTWTTPAGVSKIRITAVGAGSSSYATYTAVNNNNNPLVVKSGASGATIQWTEPTVEGDVFTIIVGQPASLPVPLMNKGKVVGTNGTSTKLLKNGNVVFELGAGRVSIGAGGITTSVGGAVITKPTGISASQWSNGFSQPIGKDSFTQQCPTPDVTGSKLVDPIDASWWTQYDKTATSKLPTLTKTGRTYLKFPSATTGVITTTRLGYWEYGGGLLIEPIQTVAASVTGGDTGGNAKLSNQTVLLQTVTTVSSTEIGDVLTPNITPVSGNPVVTADTTVVKVQAESLSVTSVGTITTEDAVAKIQATATTAKLAKTVYDAAVRTETNTKRAYVAATTAMNNAKRSYDTAVKSLQTAQDALSKARTPTAITAAQKKIDTAQKTLESALTKYKQTTETANKTNTAELDAVANMKASKDVYTKLAADEKSAAEAARIAAAKAAADKRAADIAARQEAADLAKKTAQEKLEATRKAAADKLAATRAANEKAAAERAAKTAADKLARENAAAERAAKTAADNAARQAALASAGPRTTVTTQSVPGTLTLPVGTTVVSSSTSAGKTTTTRTTVVAKPAVVGKPNVSASVSDSALSFSWQAENAGSYDIQIDITAAYPVFDPKTNAIKSWTKVTGVSSNKGTSSTSFSPTTWNWNPAKAADTINKSDWKLLSYKITFTAYPTSDNAKGKSVKVSKSFTLASISGKVIKPGKTPKLDNILY